jgi:hypothetical protein
VPRANKAHVISLRKANKRRKSAAYNTVFHTKIARGAPAT